MAELPYELWRAEQVRAFDRIAIEEQGIPGYRLMSRAGRATWAAAAARWPRARSVAVICGGGNNGGDGYVIARLAQEAGLEVTLFHVGDPGRLHGDALTAAQAARKAGLEPRPFEGDDLAGFDLLVDALLGTGLEGEVRGSARAAIEAMNNAGRPVVAVDIPSGLHADTGAVLGVAVGAAVTVTFIGLKVGLFTGEGPDRAGEVVFHDLEVPAPVYQGARPAATRLVAARELPARLPRRRRTLHKGGAGHVLVIGGDTGLLGAVRMAGEAAARSGAGLVSLATRHTHAGLIAAACPFLMAHGVERGEDLAPLVERADVIAVGPGLGRELWGRTLLEVALAAERPMVVDADALNLLAEAPRRRSDWVLTPHPGEAAR
ncbi:MAG: NAD(P)H-hydrate epimerase, partial [Thiohalospira sp.]